MDTHGLLPGRLRFWIWQMDLLDLHALALLVSLQISNNVKKQQEFKFDYFSDKNQRWKLNADKLENKEGLWTSDDLWNFESKNNGYICIENTSKTKVLGATSDGKVILEDFEEGKAHHLWKKGELDAEDYFTLENSGVPKVLTAISESSLEIKGNITIR